MTIRRFTASAHRTPPHGAAAKKEDGAATRAIEDSGATLAAPRRIHIKVLRPEQSVNSTATVGSRIAASEESLPTLFGGVVSLLLIDQFAMSRTKASVHPPAAIPKISGTDT
jgi:hypothetical protein